MSYKKILSHAEVSRLGGLAIKKKFGNAHFAKLGKRSGKARKAKAKQKVADNK